MEIYKELSILNNSYPIKIQAIGVFAAPAKTAKNPIPANKLKGNGTNQIKAFPSVAPIKNKGVTSPPLKPAPRVKAVNKSFIMKS